MIHLVNMSDIILKPSQTGERPDNPFVYSGMGSLNVGKIEEAQSININDTENIQGVSPKAAPTTTEDQAQDEVMIRAVSLYSERMGIPQNDMATQEEIKALYHMSNDSVIADLGTRRTFLEQTVNALTITPLPN